MVVTTCPPPERLEQLVRGPVTDELLEQVTSHLDECPSCERTVSGLEQQADTLVMALRRSPAEPIAVDPDCRAAVTRAAQSVKEWCREVDLSFLAPPEHTGELGRLGGYRVQRVLGVGGMGVVFAALDERLGRPVALKVMKPEAAVRPESRERFLREARAAASVRHEHVVTIFQVGEEHGVPFLAMEWLPGQTLQDRLHESPLSVSEAVRIGRQMALGLAAAHEQSLIHRDIKPGNVWLAEPRDGGAPLVKLLDFGLARPVGDDTRLTQRGMLVGTPAYMAPEQVRDDGVDHRADLFSLGAVLYETLTGRRPFAARDLLAVLSELALATPPAPATLVPHVPRELSELVMRLLEKSPASRPSSAREVAEALERLEHADSVAPSHRRFTRRSLGVAGLAAGLAIGLAAVFAWLVVRPGRPTAELVPRDSEVARWVCSLGGHVRVAHDGGERDVSAVADLPAEPFDVLEIRLSGLAVTNEQLAARLAALRSLPRLESLFLDSTPLDNAGLASLRDLPRLRSLEIGNTSITNDGLVHLTPLQNLRRLSLGSTETSDVGLIHVARLTTLEALDLQNARVGSAGLVSLRSLKRLTWLDLTNTQVDDAGLESLGELPLTYLRVGRSAVSDRGLESLVAIRSLEDLDLAFSLVSDDGLSRLAELPRLVALTLGGERIGDTGLEHVVRLPLRSLELVDTRVSETGLRRIATLRSLRRLQLSGDWPSASIAELRAALPACELTWRQEPGSFNAQPQAPAPDAKR